MTIVFIEDKLGWFLTRALYLCISACHVFSQDHVVRD